MRSADIWKLAPWFMAHDVIVVCRLSQLTPGNKQDSGLPLAFISAGEPLESVVVSRDESQLMQYLAQLVADEADDANRFNVAINVEVRFNRSKLESAIKVQVSNSPDAVKVTLTEEDIRNRYPCINYQLYSRREFGRVLWRVFDQIHHSSGKRFHDIRRG
jgi:hypothetical protein